MSKPDRQQSKKTDDGQPLPNPELRGWYGIGGFAIFGILGIAILCTFAPKENYWSIFIPAMIAWITFLAVVIQSEVVRAQLKAMNRALKQNDQMFYAANRAYIGVESIGVYDADTGKSGFPAHGKFVVTCWVVNKGKTPAFGLENAFGGAFFPRNTPREEWLEPDFVANPTARKVPQVLPEQVSAIHGDPMQVVEPLAAKIINGDLLFVVSTKFSFNCLGVKDETFIVHHLWNHRKNVFMESGIWPPDLSFADPGKPEPEDGQ